METEQTLADYVLNTRYEELPAEPIAIAKHLTLTVAGTAIAGAKAEGCEALVNQVLRWGGSKEATILLHGGKVPAHNAAFVNTVMARALDYCDGMTPRLPAGSGAWIHARWSMHSPWRSTGPAEACKAISTVRWPCE